MQSDSGDDSVRYLRERLATLGTITTRRRVGAVGVVCDGLMVGILADGGLFFRVDAGNRAAFERARFGPALGYTRQGRRIELAYLRVPDRLIDDPEEFLGWARSAFGAAQRVAGKSTPRAPWEKGTGARRRGR